MTERMKDLRMTGERTRPNLIRNIIREIVSVSVSWEMSGYPPLPWEYSGIIGDFTHWHLFLNFLQLQMSESEPAAPPHKSKYFIIIKDIFLSSFKDFSFDRTQCIVIALSFASAHLSPESQTVGEEGRMATNNRFWWHKEREYSPADDVTRDMWRGLMTVTSHSSHSWLDTVTPPSSQHPVVVVCSFTTNKTVGLIRSLTWQIMKRKWSPKTVPMAMAPVVVGTSLQLEKFYSHLIRRQFHH